ncbi:MAG: o-succinylbenzoate synthase [Chloroflexi bacterium]|nr:o-succinylbenzoate synthase [Chloroflexota bacterium]
MRIESIELRHIKIPYLTPFQTSFGVGVENDHTIIAIKTDGVIGWGECVASAEPYYSAETAQTAWHVLRDFIIPSLLGKNISSVDDALALMARVRGHNMAKAGVEAALWDAFAKQKEISLAKILGGTRDEIVVGVSIGLQPSVADLVKRVAGYLSEGYARIKIKIEPGRDVELAAAVRKEFPNILLQVDANSAYSLRDIARLRPLDQFNLLLIEQPLGYDDIYDHSKLARELTTPICLDESIDNVSDANVAMELGACKIINIKPGRVGGFSESKKIHDACAARNVPVWHGGMLESGIGRAGNIALASLENFRLPGDISASKRYFSEDIVEPEFEMNRDGTITVPTQPGIGVEVKMNRLERVTQSRAEFKANRLYSE